MCLEALRKCIASLLGLEKGLNTKQDHSNKGKTNARNLIKNRVAPIPLTGTFHIKTAKEIEENVNRQLAQDGILAKRSAGGIVFNIGNVCQFDIIEKRPRRLPPMAYSKEDKMLMASIMKDDNLRSKGELAKTSAERKLRAAEKRRWAELTKTDRVRSKQEKVKQRLAKRKP